MGDGNAHLEANLQSMTIRQKMMILRQNQAAQAKEARALVHAS